jgi:hypothetical protein
MRSEQRPTPPIAPVVPPKPRPEEFGLTEHRVQELARGSGGAGCILSVAAIVAGWVVLGQVYKKFDQYLITAGDETFRVVAGVVSVVIFLALLPLAAWLAYVLDEASTRRWRNRQPDLAQYVLYGAALKSYETSVSEAQRQHKQAIEQFELALRQWNLSQLSWWLGLDGPQFEQEVGQLLRTMGYRVQHMGGSGDRGVDLLIEGPDQRKAIVQCKAHKAPIGPGTVRDLYGALTDSGLPEGWVISTSNFTGGAQEFAKGKPIRLIHIRELLPPGKPAGQTDEADSYDAEERLAIQQEAEGPPKNEVKAPNGETRF